MKVGHVSLYDYGGAGVVAKRLHFALLAMGVDTLLATKFGTISENIPSHIFFQDGKGRGFLRRKMTRSYLRPLFELLKKLTLDPHLMGRPDGFETFSTLYRPVHSSFFNPLSNVDIIHLHWIGDFIDYESFFRQFRSKKFVWTLHDMNPLTGGCHHSDGCTKFTTTCNVCPQLKHTINESYSQELYQKKMNALRHLTDDQMVIVSPSQWLSALSLQSRLTKRFRHVVIPNPAFQIPPSGFDKNQLRAHLKLPVDKKIVMFASENLRNKRKGIDLLFQSVRALAKKEDIVLLGVGTPAGKQQGLNISYVGSVSDIQSLAAYYGAADIFVTSSIAENSPLVVIESLFCGTPVVASNVGGIPNLVSSENGILFNVGNTADLSSAITKALFEKEFDRVQIMRNARMKYESETVTNEYLKIYSLLRNQES